MTDEKAHSCFISYSRQDIEFIRELSAALEIGGITVLRDLSHVAKGEDYWKATQQLIVSSDAVVIALGSHSLKSAEVSREIDFAVSLNKRVIPIIVDDISGSAIPDAIKRLSFIFFIPNRLAATDGSFQSGVASTISAIRHEAHWVKKHADLIRLASAWKSSDHPNDLTLRKKELDEANSAVEAWPTVAPQLPSVVMEFLGASNNRQWWEHLAAWIYRGVAILLCFVVVVGVWFYRNEIGFELKVFADSLYLSPPKLQGESSSWPGQEFQECPSCPRMVVVRSGEFTRGSSEKEYTMPVRRITIPRHFAVGRFAVTFDEWNACVRHGYCRVQPNDHGRGRGKMPVVSVSISDAHAFVKWLSDLTRSRYRLLSETEWEYVATNNTLTRYPWGDEPELNRARCADCGPKYDDDGPVVVDKFGPNTFGLFNIIGNVWQWTEDCESKDYSGHPVDGSPLVGEPTCSRVVRGGSFNNNLSQLQPRIARGLNMEEDRRSDVGFRVARELQN